MTRREIGSQKTSTVLRKPRLMFRSRALCTAVSMPCAHTIAPPRNPGTTRKTEPVPLGRLLAFSDEFCSALPPHGDRGNTQFVGELGSRVPSDS